MGHAVEDYSKMKRTTRRRKKEKEEGGEADRKFS